MEAAVAIIANLSAEDEEASGSGDDEPQLRP